jgi:hypothetical protein
MNFETTFMKFVNIGNHKKKLTLDITEYTDPNRRGKCGCFLIGAEGDRP